MNITDYDPELFHTTGGVTKLNEEYYIQIEDDLGDYFKILIFKPVTKLFGDNWDLILDDTFFVNKTAALKKCFKIYQQNNEVGADLFIKALDIDLLEKLKRREESRGI